MKKYVEQQDIAHFNEFRESLVGKEFSREEIQKLLNEQMDYPRSDRFLIMMSRGENPPIKKLRHDVYIVDSKPTYRDRLQLIFYEYYKAIKAIPIDEAILALKEAGYRIYKPDVKYIEI
jgi:hypothetical protein